MIKIDIIILVSTA